MIIIQLEKGKKILTHLKEMDLHFYGSGSSFTNWHNVEYDYLTVCPRSSDPFYIVSYYIKWVTTSWTHSI